MYIKLILWHTHLATMDVQGADHRSQNCWHYLCQFHVLGRRRTKGATPSQIFWRCNSSECFADMERCQRQIDAAVCCRVAVFQFWVWVIQICWILSRSQRSIFKQFGSLAYQVYSQQIG